MVLALHTWARLSSAGHAANLDLLTDVSPDAFVGSVQSAAGSAHVLYKLTVRSLWLLGSPNGDPRHSRLRLLERALLRSSHNRAPLNLLKQAVYILLSSHGVPLAWMRIKAGYARQPVTSSLEPWARLLIGLSSATRSFASGARPGSVK